MKPYRNLTRFSVDFDKQQPSASQIDELASSFAYRDPEGFERISMGFINSSGSSFHERVGGGVLFTIKTARKVPPDSFVKEVFNKRVSDMERTQGVVLSREESESLKNEIRRELTPRALPVIRHAQCYLNFELKTLWLDSKNEELIRFINLLMENTIPGLKVLSSAQGTRLESKMMDLLQGAGDWPKGFRPFGDGASANRAGKVHIKPMAEFLKEGTSNVFELRYLGAASEGMSFRWHPDGTISFIEGHRNFKDQVPGLLKINRAIDMWLNKER